MSAPHFREERKSARENFPWPREGEEVFETLPTLVWLAQEGAARYRVEVFRAGARVLSAETEKTYLTPQTPLDPGIYRWTVTTDTGICRPPRTFTVAKNAVTVRRPTAEELLAAVPGRRPRHLFFAEDIPGLCAAHRTELTVLRRNAELAYRDGLPGEPRFLQNGYETSAEPMSRLPYREYFGRFRDFCDRDMVACALLYALEGDRRAGEYAKAVLLRICSFDPAAESALYGHPGDEIGLSCTRCLPAVFDLLYPLLDAAEREAVAGRIADYGRQCYARITALDYCVNPSESHVGRLPAYLGEAALVLSDTATLPRGTLLAWLGLALDVFGGIFPYYGTPDGAWAEGPFYASSYTKWYLPFFSAVRRLTGADFLLRPFYQRYGTFLLHFADPSYEIHPFGDGYWCRPEDAEWPGFFAQNPYRVYADRFGSEELRALDVAARVQKYYDLHLLDIFLPAGGDPGTLAPLAGDVAAFYDGGFVAMHTHRGAPDDIAVMARASRYGSDSHRYPDQGSFALFVGGVAMISPSGYFGRRYGSAHHRLWTNSTQAHNALLFNGEGQPPDSREATGQILWVDGEARRALLDLSAAYRQVDSWTREIALSGRELVVTDTVRAGAPVTVTYPLHTLSRPEAGADGTVLVRRGGHLLTVVPVEGGMTLTQITDSFAVDLNEGEPQEYRVQMPPQYHITYTSPAACAHRIVFRYRISD